MTTTRAAGDEPTQTSSFRPAKPLVSFQPRRPHISTKFQVLLGLYILLIGSMPVIVQASLFGLQGGTSSEFALAAFTEMAHDLLLLGAVMVLSRQPLGVLHPLLLAVVVWPLISGVPSAIQDYGGWAGVMAEAPVKTPFYYGLASTPASTIWLAIAKYNLVDIIRILSIYAGFSAFTAIPRGPLRPPLLPRSDSVRSVVLGLIAISTIVLLVFVGSRGGVVEHLASLGNGRFREIGQAGIVIVAIHLEVLALCIWTAARPQDVKNPLFIGALVVVIIGQFVGNGSRSAALGAPLLVALTWAVRTQRVPWRIGLLLVPVLFAGLGLMGAIRTSSWTKQTATQAFSQTGVSKSLQVIQAEVEQRRALITAIPIVERSFDATGPMLGKTYLGAITSFVPRAVWPNKPRGPDSLYVQVFLHESAFGRGIPVAEPEELYWNFGILGELIFGFLYGILLRRIYYYYWKNFPNPISIAFYTVFITTFHFSTENLVTFEQSVVLVAICSVFIAIAPKTPIASLHYVRSESPRASPPTEQLLSK